MSGRTSATSDAAVVTKRVLAFVCLAFVLLVVAPAGAGTSAAPKGYRYRVIEATHSSSEKKNDPPFYTGSSTSTWHLAPATSDAPNVIDLALVGRSYYGLGYVNISGVYTYDATDRQNGHCQFSAPTGSKDYPAVAPGPFPLTISQDPNASSRAIVTIGLGLAVYATLGPPYGNCRTSLSGEPDVNTALLTSIPKSDLGRPIVTVLFAGHTNSDGIDYSWSTTIKLELMGAGGAAPPPTGSATGTVLVNGQPFTSGTVPYGSTLDVTSGTLTMTTDVGTVALYGDGTNPAQAVLTRTSERVKKTKRPLVQLELAAGDFSACKARTMSGPARGSSDQKPNPKPVRSLWGKGKGHFRTKGRYSSATVRGTVWLTTDRCDGTLTVVKQGVVSVNDFTRKKTVKVTAGKSYLAPAHRPH
jgi:hypothetical protein